MAGVLKKYPIVKKKFAEVSLKYPENIPEISLKI